MVIYKHKTDGWRGKALFQDKNGRSKYKWFRGTTQAEVKKKIKEFESSRNLETPDADMTVNQLCQLAIDRAVERGCRPNTVRGYKTMLSVHIAPKIGRLKAADLKAWHVESLMEEMQTSWQTKIHLRAFLRSAINKVGIKSGVLNRNEASLADLPKRPLTTKRPTLTVESLHKILDAEKSLTRRALYHTIASTGLRMAEAMNLTWAEIQKKDDGYWIVLKESKTQAGLDPIPVPSFIMEEIDQLSKHSIFVFPSEAGVPYAQPNLRKAWIKALDRAGVPQTNIYQLRKLYGSLMAQSVNDVVLKRLMRHTDVRTTKQFYVNAFDSDLRAAVENSRS